MNKKILKILLSWAKPYISGTALHSILDKSSDSRHAIIKRAIKSGYLTPIRRDLFLVNNPKLPHVDSFELAPIVYGPSYVSLESSLSFYGWIPEAVRTTTCISVKRTREFETPIGIFSYKHIPIKAFSIGVEQHQGNSPFFIAAPMKAIADIIYTKKRTWETIDDLCEDLRIEPESFRDLDKQLLKELIAHYPSLRVRNVLKNLQKGLQP